jgi:aminoglycoside 2''-phosphotransferase
MTGLPYATLPQLSGFRIPVYASTAVYEHARVLAQRFEQAFTYITNLLQIPVGRLAPPSVMLYPPIPVGSTRAGHRRDRSGGPGGADRSTARIFLIRPSDSYIEQADALMADQSLDLDAIGAGLATLFANLDSIMPLHVLGSGFSSLVVETAGGIVFRIARNDRAARQHAKEARLLPQLKSFLPLPIPEPQWYAGPSDTFPFGLIGYHKLAGVPLHSRRLAPSSRRSIALALASFLRALHGFPTSKARALHLPGPAEFREQMATLRLEVLPPLRQALRRHEYHTLAQWWDAFLCDPALEQYTPVLQHGDLWYENILTDATASMLTGVLDFESSAIGDPAQDFATLNYFDPQFVRKVIEAYQAAGDQLGEDFDYRVQKYWELRDFDGVQFAVRFNDAEEFEDALRKLRKGPILNPQ